MIVVVVVVVVELFTLPVVRRVQVNERLKRYVFDNTPDKGNNILASVDGSCDDEGDDKPARAIMRFALPFTLPARQRFVMPLGAYFDESGTNRTDPALVMAGFVSTDELWGEFSHRWKDAITGWGLTHWHMADFEARQGEFRDWPRDDESRRRLGHLLDLITNHMMATVSAVFPRDLFHSYYAPNSTGPKGPELLYRVTAGEAMREVSYLPREYLPGSRIALVFESGARGRHEVQLAYDGLEDSVLEYMNFLSLTFAKKTEFEPLQAADILAYEQFRHYPKAWGDETRDTRYPLKRIFGKGLPHAGGVITRELLDSLFATFRGSR